MPMIIYIGLYIGYIVIGLATSLLLRYIFPDDGICEDRTILGFVALTWPVWWIAGVALSIAFLFGLLIEYICEAFHSRN